MPAIQERPLARNPNALDLVCVATYQRTIEASLERVWENVLDWEHLSHLHDSSFSYCALDEADAWGWRTWSNPEHSDHIELCIDQHCYVARSYSQGLQVSEIWTSLSPQGDKTAITVEFFSTGVEPAHRDKVGEVYLSLYRRLWDEDEEMMQQRQYRLDQKRDAATEIDLGDATELAKKLPLTIELGRTEYQIVAAGDTLRVSATICPHRLGPLQPTDDSGLILRCPWHGYQFDSQSGRCLSPANANCKLRPAPTVHTRDGRVYIRAASA